MLKLSVWFILVFPLCFLCWKSILWAVESKGKKVNGFHPIPNGENQFQQMGNNTLIWSEEHKWPRWLCLLSFLRVLQKFSILLLCMFSPRISLSGILFLMAWEITVIMSAAMALPLKNKDIRQHVPTHTWGVCKGDAEDWRESSRSDPDYVRSADLQQLWFEHFVRFLNKLMSRELCFILFCLHEWKGIKSTPTVCIFTLHV